MLRYAHDYESMQLNGKLNVQKAIGQTQAAQLVILCEKRFYAYDAKCFSSNSGSGCPEISR